MPPLQRTVAFEQMNRAAVGVGEHLDLDVTGPRGVFLDQTLVVADTGGRLAPTGGQGLGEVLGGADLAHALAAAAGHGLDQHRIADLVGFGLQAGLGLVLA